MKILKKNCCFLFVAGIILYLSGCLSNTGIEKNSWFRYASEYDKARSKMLVDAETGTFLQDVNEMNKIKHNFLRTSPPKESEIMWVFMSPNRELQKIGLAAMSLRPIETERIQRTLIEFLQDPNFYFKEYAFLSLNKFKENPADKNDAVRKRLLEIIKNEEGKGKGKGNISFREFLLLAKFPSQETALFLQDQLMKEGQENKIYRIAAFSALKKMGEPYFTKVLEYVKNHSTPEMKKELLERENTWLDTSF